MGLDDAQGSLILWPTTSTVSEARGCFLNQSCGDLGDLHCTHWQWIPTTKVIGSCHVDSRNQRGEACTLIKCQDPYSNVLELNWIEFPSRVWWESPLKLPTFTYIRRLRWPYCAFFQPHRWLWALDLASDCKIVKNCIFKFQIPSRDAQVMRGQSEDSLWSLPEAILS